MSGSVAPVMKKNCREKVMKFFLSFRKVLTFEFLIVSLILLVCFFFSLVPRRTSVAVAMVVVMVVAMEEKYRG